VIGGTIPGVPGGAGRPVRAALGWGLTSAYVDDQDVFIEQLNPDNPEVPHPDGWKISTRRSIMTVKDAAIPSP
jgi:penicillin G amidase